MKKLTADQLRNIRLSPDAIDPGLRVPVCGVIENVRSLYNVGSIFRTADAVLLKELVLAGFTPRPPRKEIDKTALGATSTVPWRSFPSGSEALRTLKQGGYTLCAVETTTASRNIFGEHTLPTPLALVFGNEITGISDEALALCDLALEIPMHGSKHSLNVAVAFGVAVFAVTRRLR